MYFTLSLLYLSKHFEGVCRTRFQTLISSSKRLESSLSGVGEQASADPCVGGKNKAHAMSFAYNRRRTYHEAYWEALAEERTNSYAKAYGEAYTEAYQKEIGYNYAKVYAKAYAEAYEEVYTELRGGRQEESPEYFARAFAKEFCRELLVELRKKSDEKFAKYMADRRLV